MKNVNQMRYQQQQDKKIKEAVNVAAIVKVTRFDPAKMIVDVQPLSKHLENGVYQSQPPILDVPVSSTRSGGFIVRPWINVEDVGLLIYIDHDIDKAVENGQENKPNTERNHSTSDGVFVGGIVLGIKPMSGIPDDAVVISNDNATTFIALLQDEIKATVGETTVQLTPDSVEINTTNVKINAGGSVIVSASGEITMTGSAINLNP